jgi:hypothetical protein
MKELLLLYSMDWSQEVIKSVHYNKHFTDHLYQT